MSLGFPRSTTLVRLPKVTGRGTVGQLVAPETVEAPGPVFAGHVELGGFWLDRLIAAAVAPGSIASLKVSVTLVNALWLVDRSAGVTPVPVGPVVSVPPPW